MALWHRSFVIITSSLHKVWVGLLILDPRRCVSMHHTTSRAEDCFDILRLSYQQNRILPSWLLHLLNQKLTKPTIPENPILMELWSIELVTADSYNVRVSTDSKSSVFPVSAMTIRAVKLYCWPVPVGVWMLSGMTIAITELPNSVISLTVGRAIWPKTLKWHHNERDRVSNRQPHDYLFDCSFRRSSKKTSNLRVTGLCAGNSPGTGEFPHKWPVTRKMFPFDDVIMNHRHQSSPCQWITALLVVVVVILFPTEYNNTIECAWLT